MAVNYTVLADIIDITVDTPKPEDSFLVDTNVWYWLAYTRASLCPRPPAEYQTTKYPKYTNAALGAGARVYQSGISLPELAHIIEKSEREIYERANGQHMEPKEYRHNLAGQKAQVFAEIRVVWKTVTTLGDPLTITIDPLTTTAALNRLQAEKVDGYDLFILESMTKCGVAQVITDDGDFATVPSIQVFTANRKVIHAARAQGRLITR